MTAVDQMRTEPQSRRASLQQQIERGAREMPARDEQIAQAALVSEQDVAMRVGMIGLQPLERPPAQGAPKCSGARLPRLRSN
ncbi:MAG: hypothetical protein WDO18_11425 [Acidobacteriota bacterium]